MNWRLFAILLKIFAYGVIVGALCGWSIAIARIECDQTHPPRPDGGQKEE